MAEPGTASPQRLIPVIINHSGGTASRLGARLRDEVEAAFRGAGAEPAISLVAPEDLVDAVRAAQGPVVAVGGGDGTLGTAAGVLAESGQALAILPLGTRNHLARQLAVPLDLPGAARVAIHGTVRRIDLGCAADRVFVNNCSVGLYPRLVHARDRVPLGLPKWLATLPALFTTLRTLRSEHFRLEWNGCEHRIESPLLFIGNNRYLVGCGRLGQRASLSDGLLALAAVHPPRRRSLVWSAFKLLAGRFDPEKDFAAQDEMAELWIYGHGLRHVALDGEVVRLRFPLRIRTLPGALAVMVPEQPPGD